MAKDDQAQSGQGQQSSQGTQDTPAIVPPVAEPIAPSPVVVPVEPPVAQPVVPAEPFPILEKPFVIFTKGLDSGKLKK